MSPLCARLALAALPLVVGAGAAPAQDVEAVAELRGLRVPDGYFEAIARNPAAFTLPHGLFRTTADGRAPSRVEGTVRLPVLLALFADSPEPHVAREDVQRALFDGPAERGTITEAYLEMSRGALEVTGDVLPWVRTSYTMLATVGTSNGLGDDADLGPYLMEALALVDPDVDFGIYDSDGPDGVPNSGDDDGFVDAMTFEFIEVSGSCGGPSIWPHRSALAFRGGPFYTDDLRPDGSRVLVNGYIVQGVTECDGVTLQSANVIAHEFGHVLGLPDYYHPTASGGAPGRRWVLGCWSLMAAGSWGCGPLEDEREPFGPTHLDAHSKAQLGWLDFEEIGEVWDHEIVLEPSQTSGRGLRIPLNGGEEFLEIEYRARLGFDAQLPAAGVLVYHYDPDGELRPDTAGSAPYRLALVEADGNGGLRRNTFEGGNRGEAGDAWGVGGLVRTLHAASLPAALRLNGGGTSTVTIHEVAVDGDAARLRISTGATPRISPAGAAFVVPQVSPFFVRVRVGGGTMPYAAEGAGLPAGTEVYALHDQLIVAGSVASADTLVVLARVRDAAGRESAAQTIAIAGGTPWTVTEARLLQPFLRSGAEPLSAPELEYLDTLGNGNGRYDVGDLRRWLREEALSARIAR